MAIKKSYQSDYSKKLLDPRWQKKRLEILNRDGFKCVECNSDVNTLHVHHKNYYYGNDPWEYQNTNLITLCENCHSTEEAYKTMLSGMIHDLLLMGHSNASIYYFLEENYQSIPMPHYLNKVK